MGRGEDRRYRRRQLNFSFASREEKRRNRDGELRDRAHNSMGWTCCSLPVGLDSRRSERTATGRGALCALAAGSPRTRLS